MKHLLVLYGLLCFVVSCGNSLPDTPPYYGVFFIQDKEYAEIPLYTGGPTTDDNFPLAEESQPLFAVWQAKINLDLFRLHSMKESNGRYRTGQEIAYNVAPGEDGVLEMRPKDPLPSGAYCFYQGDWMMMPGDIKYWCFRMISTGDSTMGHGVIEDETEAHTLTPDVNPSDDFQNKLTFLAPPGILENMFFPAVINNVGQVVGTRYINNHEPYEIVVGEKVMEGGFKEETQVLLWQDGVMTELLTFEVEQTGVTVIDINEHGHIVLSHADEDRERHTSLWQDGVMTELVGYWVNAEALNNNGQIVGQIHTGGEEASFRAFMWQDGVMTDLGILDGHYTSRALDINDHGQIVGTSTGAVVSEQKEIYNTHMILWEDGEMIDLGPCDCADLSINNQGQIVGLAHSNESGGEDYVFLFDNGTVVNLDISEDSIRFSEGDLIINNNVQIAGNKSTEYIFFDAPFLWDSGQVTQLTTDGRIAVPIAINDHGQIVGIFYTDDFLSGQPVMWE